MKKGLIIFIITLFITTATFAQQSRIHAIKVAYISDKLHLPASTATQFWPVYNKYDEESHNIRKGFYQKYKNTNPKAVDDATARKFVDDDLDYQQDMVALRRKYHNQFLTILTPQQLATLY